MNQNAYVGLQKGIPASSSYLVTDATEHLFPKKYIQSFQCIYYTF